MFKFDFNIKAEDQEESSFTSKTKVNETDDNKIANEIECYEAEEIIPKGDILENLDVYKLNSTETLIGDLTLVHILAGFVIQDVTKQNVETGGTQDIKKAEQNHTDLIPGVYEGGAKIWECTDDLLRYVNEKYSNDFWRSKNVLDLGCGAGLLGIYAYKCGAKVCFQDYNKDVLEEITIPNLLLNVAMPPNVNDLNLKQLCEVVQFYAGDWSKYVALTSDQNKFDLILTSETIYNAKNQQKLLDTLHAKVKPTGAVLVAAKTHYFGVGGGVRQFEQLIAKDKRFKTEVLWTAAEGVGREIIEMKPL